MLLARAGHDVLLVDRGTVRQRDPARALHPSPRPAAAAPTGACSSPCWPRTARRRRASRWTSATAGSRARSWWPTASRSASGRAARGWTRVLVEAAAAAGAEVREHFVVDDLIERDGRVAGVRGRRLPSPAVRSERARVVIGADGRGSGVARRVGARVKLLEPTVSCWYFSYWSGVPAPGSRWPSPTGGWSSPSRPTTACSPCSSAGRSTELPACGRTSTGSFQGARDRPGLAERVRAGTRAERVLRRLASAQLPAGGVGPGWALVGDAGCHKDPFRALGVCDALRDAELLAGALSAGLADEDLIDDALAGLRDTARRGHAGRLPREPGRRPPRARPARAPGAARARAGQPGRDRPLLPRRGGPPR